MNPATILFFFRRAMRDMADHRFLHAVTIITIALSVLIVSAFGLFFINTSEVLDSWKKGLRIMVYLKPTVKADRIPDLKATFEDNKTVLEAIFLPRDTALRELKQQLQRQASLLENLRENPLPDAFDLRITPSGDAWDEIEALAVQIGAMPEVAEVEYGRNWMGRFAGVFNLFKVSGIFLCCVFFMASVFIVANTIRLLFYSRSEELEIMRLVGATDAFIKGPFYILGFVQGLFGGLLGLLVLLGIFRIVASNVTQGLSAYMLQLHFLPFQIMAGILVLSMFTGWLGCYLSFKQFLGH